MDRRVDVSISMKWQCVLGENNWRRLVAYGGKNRGVLSHQTPREHSTVAGTEREMLDTGTHWFCCSHRHQARPAVGRTSPDHLQLSLVSRALRPGLCCGSWMGTLGSRDVEEGLVPLLEQGWSMPEPGVPPAPCGRDCWTLTMCLDDAPPPHRRCGLWW